MFLALALLAVPIHDYVLPAVQVGELDRLVLECDRIVRARITNVHEFSRGFQYPEGPGDPGLEESTVRILELQVGETYWGSPEEKSLFVLDDTRYGGMRLHGSPEKGQDSIWFLELDPWFERLAPLPRERISQLAGRTGLQVVALDGLGCLRLEQRAQQPVVCLHAETWTMPPSLAIVGVHSTAKPEREWLQVAQPALEEWLRKLIRNSVPSIQIDVVSTSPRRQEVRIDQQGHAELFGASGGNKSADLGGYGMQKLIQLARSERFFELPTQMGQSQYPESPIYCIRIRTEQGARLVSLHGPEDADCKNAALLDAQARAMRIWDAIPLARDWKITGH